MIQVFILSVGIDCRVMKNVVLYCSPFIMRWDRMIFTRSIIGMEIPFIVMFPDPLICPLSVGSHIDQGVDPVGNDIGPTYAY